MIILYFTRFLLTVSLQVQYILPDGSILVQKETKRDTNKNIRRMIVVNQQDLQQTTTTAQVPQVTQQRIITQQIPANGGVVETKPSPATITTNASGNSRLTQQVITPMGPLTLTADEYSELMQRRMQKAHNDEVNRKAVEAQERAQQEAMARAQQEAQQRAAQQQQLQDHQNIASQVQKIVASLEEDIDKKDEDIEMQMIVPKMETDSVQGEEGTSSDTKVKSEAVDKNAGRPFACDKCGKKFLLKHHLTTHARVHSGELQVN